MRRADYSRLLSATALGAGLFFSGSALAVNPLEYPDNGAEQFSRGGAWLATANSPIATHYNPAALATIDSGVSIDVRLNYQDICFERWDENGEPALLYRETASAEPFARYPKQCMAREAFPLTIPALSIAWRASERLGFGLAMVPPAAYGTANEAWPAIAEAVDPSTGETRRVPASYRYMTMGNQSTILFPTLSVGYEPFDNFRIGAGFVSGMAIINVFSGGISTVNADPNLQKDAAREDSYSNLRVRDLFVPGAVASIHWSATRFLDFALWGRISDSIKAHEGVLRVNTRYFNANTGYDRPSPVCPQEDPSNLCGGASLNTFDKDIVDRFEFPFPPPEVRAGVRFHLPRSEATEPEAFEVRDPLHDDIFDVELNGSYTNNANADAITVRFKYDEASGAGPALTPVGFLPPIVDQPTGFKDSFGLRFGGQYNVMQDKLALMAGTWFETESQKPELLNVNPPGPTRGGFGGGITFRQEFLDLTFGYQYHWSSGIETTDGLRRANAGSLAGGPGGGRFSVNDEPLEIPPEDRRVFRSFHVVNNGRVTQSAHAFSLGGTMRF